MEQSSLSPLSYQIVKIIWQPDNRLSISSGGGGYYFSGVLYILCNDFSNSCSLSQLEMLKMANVEAHIKEYVRARCQNLQN